MMFFGTRQNMEWVPAPNLGVERTRSVFMRSTQLANGASAAYRSLASAGRLELDWGLKKASELRHIEAVAAGAYTPLSADAQIEVYVLDPFAMDTNVLPPHWSVPALALTGAPNLAGDAYQDNLEAVTNSNVSYGYPVTQARFHLGDGSYTWSDADARTLWIPVPNGYTFYFGLHAISTSTTASRVTLTPTSTGTPVNATPLGVNTATLTNYTHASTSDADGVTIQFTGDENSVLDVCGMIAQILPTGSIAPTGKFIVGNGYEKFRLDGELQKSGYSAALDLEQFSLALEEKW
jgi:hypothetical protein